MYIPSAFAQNDLAALWQFMDQHSFATLCSAGEDGLPFASHLPILLDRETRPQGKLLGHVARANPHWRLAQDRPVLVIFTGPHHYISPAWYEAEKVVPTWNYTAVHVQGVLRVLHDPDRLLAILHETVKRYESPRPAPWPLEDGAFVEGLLKGIVGFEVEITRILGKWKLSQNQPAERQQKVRRALRELGGEDALAMAEMMEGLQR